MAGAGQGSRSGCSQLVSHGWPYSPPEAGTPGWPFYAAAVLSDKNPWWPVMPDLAAYLQRVSFLLRQGEPVADVALYAPTDDAWSTFKPGTPRYLNLFLKIVDWIGPKVVPAILDAGHGFRTATAPAEQWDPRTGGVERLQAQRGEIALALEPYASRVIVFRKDARSARAARSRVVSASEDLRSGWNVRFGDTGAG